MKLENSKASASDVISGAEVYGLVSTIRMKADGAMGTNIEC